MRLHHTMSSTQYLRQRARVINNKGCFLCRYCFVAEHFVHYIFRDYTIYIICWSPCFSLRLKPFVPWVGALDPQTSGCLEGWPGSNNFHFLSTKKSETHRHHPQPAKPQPSKPLWPLCPTAGLPPPSLHRAAFGAAALSPFAFEPPPVSDGQKKLETSKLEKNFAVVSPVLHLFVEAPGVPV